MGAAHTNGKICYVEIPASHIARVFGWHLRKRGDGSTAFDDTTGQVSGAWVLGRPPAEIPGFSFMSWWIACGDD